MALETVEAKPQPYSIKLEGTAKGVRLSVHVHGPEGMSDQARTLAIDEAIKAWQETQVKGAEKGIVFEVTK